jgi:hypothetical protein
VNEDTRKTSLLALAGLGTILAWYAAWLVCVLYVYRTRGTSSQRWDLIPVMWVCWAGWYPFCVAATALGIVALLRIRASGGQLAGARLAVAAITLSQASFVVGLAGPYLPDFLP